MNARIGKPVSPFDQTRKIFNGSLGWIGSNANKVITGPGSALRNIVATAVSTACQGLLLIVIAFQGASSTHSVPSNLWDGEENCLSPHPTEKIREVAA